jgi:hypothetical protein
MSAPVKPFLGLVAAFAGGVAATVAFVGHKDRAPETAAASKSEKVASLAASPSASNDTPAAHAQPPSGTDRWVDPTKHSTPAPAAHSSLPPLVFHLDGRPEHAKSAASQKGGQVGAGQAQHSIVAQVSPPPRPSVSELKAEPAGRPAPAAKPIDRPPTSKPSDDLAARKAQAHRLTARLSHKSEAARIASTDNSEDDESPAVERQIRRVYVPSRGYGYAAGQPYARRYVELSDRYERDTDNEPRQYRREAPSSQASGVMRWLAER